MSTVAEDYLEGRNGSIENYHIGLACGWRLGQAFFNALDLQDQNRLRGTLHDPFNKVTQESIHKAVEFLLDSELGHVYNQALTPA